VEEDPETGGCSHSIHTRCMGLRMIHIAYV